MSSSNNLEDSLDYDIADEIVVDMEKDLEGSEEYVQSRLRHFRTLTEYLLIFIELLFFHLRLHCQKGLLYGKIEETVSRSDNDNSQLL